MYSFFYREEAYIQLKMEGKIALVWRDKNVLKKENPDGHLITQMQKHGLVAPFQNHVDYLKVQYIYQDSKARFLCPFSIKLQAFMPYSKKSCCRENGP